MDAQRNLKTMETVKSINDVQANKHLLSKMNTIQIEKFKYYNFDLEG